MKQLALAALTRTPLHRLFRPWTRGRALIFTLHRFIPAGHAGEGHPVDALARGLAELRAAGYRFAPLGEVVAHLRGERPLAPGSIAFTVDDGYEDFARLALPVFAREDCPVTLFVTTGFIDGTCWMWWDRIDYAMRSTGRRDVTLELPSERWTASWADAAEASRHGIALAERLKPLAEETRLALVAALAERLEVALPVRAPAEYAPMTWDMVRAAARSGVSFGPHTVTHPILSRTSDARSCEEIEGSWRRLRAETDATVPVFCYPNGTRRDFGHRECALAAAAGLDAAVSTSPDHLPPAPMPERTRFALPRYAWPDDAPHLLQVACGMERAKSQVRRALGQGARA